MSEPERLPARLRRTVERGVVHLSVISYWEVVIKTAKGALDVGDPRRWWVDVLDAFAARALPVRPEHVSTVCELPPIHKDPFDRMLIAQAIAANLVLVTTDRTIPLYASHRLQVLSSPDSSTGRPTAD